jgi:hypothetical protein
VSEQPGHNPYQPNPYGGSAGYNPYQLGPNGVPIGPPPDHPQMTTVLLLGILGLAVCQVVSPFAWVMGRRTLTEIDASQGRWGGRSNVKIGYVLGIVGSCILGLYLVGGIIYLLVIIVAIATSA